MNNTAFALPLAYPDTVVMVSDEWYVKHLHYVGVGKKNYVKAGHAAMVLINKETGYIEYFDFGRYITPQPFGRVRSETTDHELKIPFKAIIENGELKNRDAIFKFFASHHELTHGEGRLITTVCDEVDYDKAKDYINALQDENLIEYAAFKKNASNCARFVTDTLINASNNPEKIKKLNGTKLFTPSPIGNVLAVKGINLAYKITQKGEISVFKNSKQKEIVKCFLDRIPNHESLLQGTLKPKLVNGLDENAQWMSGIGAGAWLELVKTEMTHEYRFKRTSAFGTVDIDALFVLENDAFNVDLPFKFTYETNCSKVEVEQNNQLFTLLPLASLSQKERTA